MIKFKTVKFKHYREAQAINARIDSGEATDEEILLFALSLVKEWDFVDADNGNEPLPVGEIDELSLEQVSEVYEEFSKVMGVTTEVPKVSEELSSST